MYGRGNYASPFGQGPQRPMPPYQQQTAGLHFQQGHPFPPSVAGLPPPVSPLASAYPRPPHAPPSISQQGLPIPPLPLGLPGGTPLQRPYMAAQHNYSPGALIPHRLPPPPSSIGAPQLPPPPPTYGQTYGPVQQLPHSSQHMPLPPPPPPPPTAAGFSFPANFDSTKQSLTAESQMPSVGPEAPPLPPSSPPRPPPPPSTSSPSAKLSPAPRVASLSSPIQPGSSLSSYKAPVSESADDIETHSQNGDDGPIFDEDLSWGQSVPEDLPPPPPKPADEKTVRNIEVLCQFIAKNGPSFEEMARQKEHGNQEFKFLFGGDPGSEAACAHKYYLWMKKKYGLVSSSHEGQGHITSSQGLVDADPLVQSNSLTIIGTTHSSADSDVDMEDDITQSDKEPAVDSVEEQNPELILTGDLLKLQNQENALQYSSDSLDFNLCQPVKSQAIAQMKPEKSSSQAAKIDSPFRLIQSYASDDSSEDDGEPSHEEVKAVAVSPLKSVAISSQDTMDIKSHTNPDGRVTDTMVTPENAFRKDLDDSQEVQRGFQESLNKRSFLEKVEVDGRAEGSSPSETLQEKYAKVNHSVSEKQDKDKVPTGLKVDEFGRLVKDGASESESDDAYHSRRRSKRGRSHSRSRSPSDRRRKKSPRRSPRRRKDRRSRSRSWSPKRRRSRSRSPYRLGGDFGGDKPRRDKVQTRECFDFLKGRCYRGASCRYLHHELDRSDASRRHKSKEDHLAGVSSSRYPDIHGGNNSSRSHQENNEVKSEKMDMHLDKHYGADMPLKVCDENSKEESVDNDVLPSVSQQGVEALANVQKCEHYGEGHAQVQKLSEISNSHLPTGKEHPTCHTPPTNELAIHHPIAESSAQVHHRIDGDSQNADGSSRSDPSAVQAPAVSPSGLPVGGLYMGRVSSDNTALSNSTLELSHQTSHLLPPSIPSQPTSTTQTSSVLVDNKSMAPSVSFLPQSLPVESAPPYQAPLPNQQSHYPVPPNPSWGIPPPPPPQPQPQPQPQPPYAGDISMSAAPLSYQQGNLSLRNDFPIHTSFRTHPGELPSHSQVGRFQHQTYHMHAQFPSQGTVPFSSFGPGNVAPPPMPFPGDKSVKNLQPLQGSNALPVEPPKPTFQNQTFAQQIQLPYGPQISAADSMSSYRGGSLPVSGYSSDSLDRDHPTRFLDIGGSRISAHYNPYASTFDKPLTSRFSSAFAQEREAATGCKYDSSSAVGNNPGDGQNTGDHGPRSGGQSLHRSGGDQYDPLFDSMEPSSESFKKHSRKLGHAADNSDILKLGSSYKVLDVEENNNQKEVGAEAAAISPENDEFGETADAEVGAVENGSPSNPDEDEIGAEGEIEIDQIKSEGKSKKSKDSRSMKLFKSAVANFVKEVLKPQWRQGNMSKEVFKTIVKKTVEKVSGAMKNRRVPKSQAKIDHYIDSQRRKLTQLVEGYVSKYKI